MRPYLAPRYMVVQIFHIATTITRKVMKHLCGCAPSVTMPLSPVAVWLTTFTSADLVTTAKLDPGAESQTNKEYRSGRRQRTTLKPDSETGIVLSWASHIICFGGGESKKGGLRSHSVFDHAGNPHRGEGAKACGNKGMEFESPKVRAANPVSALRLR